jgi:hypothetical protein
MIRLVSIVPTANPPISGYAYVASVASTDLPTTARVVEVGKWRITANDLIAMLWNFAYISVA